ncbi:MAG: DUF2092 domain-containing protein [Deltaproteobacteria bacterium]|nr:DUF2092 domain-containing protein [Deltaproteobacteria bacterium]
MIPVFIGRAGLRGALAVALGLALLASPAVGAAVDPEADEILEEMSDYLSGLKAVSVDIEIENEIVGFAGQKIQLSRSVSVLLERPGRLRVRSRGGVADVELFFDGELLTVHSSSRNFYASLERPGSIDDVIGTVRSELGLDAPAGDFFFADPRTGLLRGVMSGSYLGWGYVDGVRCHHLAFREEHVDWQVWVETGDTPRPRKYVITSKWVTAAPQYVVRFRNWNSSPEVGAGQFVFAPPEGVRKVESIPVNEAGQILIEEVR